MSSIDDFVKSQQDLLIQGVQNISIENNDQSNDNPQVLQQQQSYQNLKNTKKKRAHHAFHDFSSESSSYRQPDYSLDPNEAASNIGLIPPNIGNQHNFQQSPSSLNNFTQLNTQPPFLETPPLNYDSSNQQNSKSFSNDIYNINNSTVSENLSIPSIRNEMNEIYKDKTFLSFEHVSPPPAGTQFKSIDQGNSIPQFSKFSMYSIPFCEELREKTKIPLGLCLRPFADFVPSNEIPMEVPQIKINEGEVVPRCRRCRTYLNPAMQHDGRSMTCNICGFNSPVPIEYSSTVDIRGIRDDYHVRPELHTGVVDFIVPKEYNLDENENLSPLHRIFLIDLSHSSYKSKLIETICSAIRVSIYKDDGTSNLPLGTLISIVGFDNNLHFYNLSPNLERTTISLVTDLDDPFIPFYDGIFVDPIESYNIINLTLTTIEQDVRSLAPEPALGPALKIAGMLLKEFGGGQIITTLSNLPSFGPGALLNKSNKGKSECDFIKETVTDDNKYYKDLKIEFVENNIGLNLFVAASSNVDLINIGSLAINTGGSVREWLPFNVERDDISFIYEIKKAVENIAGYQCQLKLRCSRGLQVNTYYGPFTTISGNSAPNIPIVSGDTSIVCDFIYDSKLDTKKDAHFQAALLYTSKDGLRKVRVINSILSVTQRISDVFDFSDQDAVVKIMIKRIIEKIKTTNMVTLRNTLLMQCSAIMASYKYYIAKHNTLPTQLVLPQSLRTLPMIILSILKTQAFKEKGQISDLRISSIFKLSQYNLTKLSTYLYPIMFCIHTLENDEFIINQETNMMNTPKSIPMTVNNLTFGGAYLVFNNDRIIIWLHKDVNVLLLQDLFGSHIDSIDKVTSHISQLPILDTYISHQVHNMCDYLSKHYNGLERQSVEICRFRMDPNEQEFQNLFVEDKSIDLIWSYSDFLKELHKHIENKSSSLDSGPSKEENDGENISRRFGVF